MVLRGEGHRSEVFTYQSTRRVDSCIASIDAVEPLRLAELEETLLRHAAVGGWGPAMNGETLRTLFVGTILVEKSLERLL